MKKTLYEIANDLRNVLEDIEIDEETGEILNAELLDYCQMEFEKKLEGVACFYKENLAYEDAIDAEIKKLQTRKKRVQKQNEWFKDYMKNGMLTTGTDKMETARCKLSFRASQEVEVPEDATTLPTAYQRVKTTVDADKTAIKKALKAGEVIEGCKLVDKKNLQIG